MPPSVPTADESQEALDVIPVMPNWVRGILLGLVLGLVLVFGIAIWLNPYNNGGSARRMETHRQMGFPPCTFYETTRGIPCPSCGMTTSFSLTVRGDVYNAMQANCVGALLALFCLAFIPWSLACVFTRRTFLVHALDKGLTVVILAFLALMMLRWLILVCVIWAGTDALEVPF